MLLRIMCFLLAVTFSCAKKEEKKMEGAVLSINVAKAMVGNISSFIICNGSVSPIREISITSKIDGMIEHIYVDEGDYVKKGDVLVKLDATKILKVLDERKASFSEANSNLINSRKSYERKKMLFEKKVINEQEHDNAFTELRLSEARYELAKARLKLAEQDLKDSVIYAPYSGFIVKKNMNKGEYVATMSPTEILQLVDISTVEVELELSEEYRRTTNIGDKVNIFPVAYDTDFQGTISKIIRKIDPDTRKFRIKVTILNKDFGLESGMSVKAKLILAEKNAVIVPLRAVNNGFVYVIKEDIAREIAVKTGIIENGYIEIKDGLKGDEIIAVDAFYSLKDGIKVKILQ